MKNTVKGRMFYIAFVASLGGLLFGFDTAVISGAEKAIQDKFYETPLKKLAPDHAKAFRNLSATLEKLAETTEKIIR